MYAHPRFPLDEETLDRLVTEAQRGDADAFGRIFDEYAGPIHRFIASRVSRPSDAEDLTQLVFVKALEALPRYEARGIPFGGWLFRLARNAIIDQIRTRREHLSLVEVTSRESEEASPEAMASLHDDLERVAVAMRDLTDDQREVIELRFFAGLSVAEAAEAMGRQEGTIRGLQFRAVGALRRSLGIESSGTPHRLLFLEASEDVLLDRYKETRRRHPLAGGGQVSTAIAEERLLLEPLKDRADVAIDTSDLSASRLRKVVARRGGAGRMCRIARRRPGFVRQLTCFATAH